MTREEMDFIGSMNMCDEISNEAYKKIMTHCEEQQPCNDAISRQAAIEIIKSMTNDNPSYWNSCDVINRENTLDEIEDLPSVTPQPKVGEWLEKEVNSETAIMVWQSARCSVCDKYHTTPYMYYFDDYKFCPNCGARMEVSE